MLKKMFAIGAIALGMAACNQPANEGENENTDNTEQQSHEGHDHEGHDHSGEPGADKSQYTPAEGASVSFANLKDGDTVSTTFLVQFAVEGMEVEPAGPLKDGTGHHHIIIDGEATPMGTAVPADDTHIHFGGGQTETELTLAPGEHTLIMQFANGLHQSYGPQMSAEITVFVK